MRLGCLLLGLVFLLGCSSEPAPTPPAVESAPAQKGQPPGQNVKVREPL